MRATIKSSDGAEHVITFQKSGSLTRASCESQSAFARTVPNAFEAVIGLCGFDVANAYFDFNLTQEDQRRIGEFLAGEANKKHGEAYVRVKFDDIDRVDYSVEAPSETLPRMTFAEMFPAPMIGATIRQPTVSEANKEAQFIEEHPHRTQYDHGSSDDGKDARRMHHLTDDKE